MNTYATLDNFKPGERWLAVSEGWQSLQGPFHEVECIEWSPSGKYVKVRFLTSGIVLWFPDVPYLLERLPDESKTNQTAEPARAVEDDSAFRVVFCDCILCKTVRKEHAERAELERLIKTKQAAQDATSEEIAASHKPD